MTAHVTEAPQGKPAVFRIELIRGDGRHLTRTWRTFAKTRGLLGGKLARTISHRFPEAKLRTGERVAFYATLYNAKGAYVWHRIQTASLTRLAAPTRTRQARGLGQLIERLGSPAYITRERATRRLMGHGHAALEALERARRHRDLEVRKRARALLERLQLNDCLRIERRVSSTGARG